MIIHKFLNSHGFPLMILYWSSAFSIVNRKISDFISWIRRFFGLHQMPTKAVCSICFMDRFLCYNFTKDTYSLFHWFSSFLFFIVKESWAWGLCLIVLFPLIFVAIRIRCWVGIDSDWHVFFPMSCYSKVLTVVFLLIIYFHRNQLSISFCACSYLFHGSANQEGTIRTQGRKS